MNSHCYWFACCLCAAFVSATTAQPPYLSELVGFDGPPINEPATSQEMFRHPQFSGTTNEFIVANESDPNLPPFSFNAAYRASGDQSAGDAGLKVFFNWADPNDPDAWLRLTTFEGTERPNPALHQGGMVKFKLYNRSQLFFGEIGICLGIRETGTEVAQLEDGGTSGTIEWVGVDETPNAIIAGEDGLVDTAASGDDEQVYPVGYDLNTDPNSPDLRVAVVLPGPNGVLDTAPAGDDEVRFGYYIGWNNAERPIPAVTLPPDNEAYDVTFDLATGDVAIGDPNVPGNWTLAGITPFTGDGELDPNARGTLEHIAFTSQADGATLIDVTIDEMQFSAPEPDPVLPPTVRWPIIAGETMVTVTGIMAVADEVRLYRGTGSLNDPNVALNPAGSDTVVFNIAPAAAGEVFIATQRNGQNGIVSEPSAPVTVLPDPPLYTFSILLDESGSGSCSYADPGWEWVGVTDVQTVSGKWSPEGQAVFANDAAWQTVDIPLDDDSLVIGSLGGNGALAESPVGFYTMDSLWLTRVAADPNVPWEVFVDRVELLDGDGLPMGVVLDMEDGVNRLPASRGQSPDALSSSSLSDAASFDGCNAHRLGWTYDGADLESTSALQRVSGCGTAEPIDDGAATIRVRVLCRAQPTNPAAPLPAVSCPIVDGPLEQSAVRVTHESSATSIALFVNGDLVATAANAGNAFTDFDGLTLAPGDSVSATQTLPTLGESDYAYPRGVTAAPPPPQFTELLLPGQASVKLGGLAAAPFATASEVHVYVNGSLAGNETGGPAMMMVPLSVTLQPGDSVTAMQTVNGAVSEPTEATVALTSLVSEYEFAPTLATLSRSIAADDFINGRIGLHETGDVDLVNGVESWNMTSQNDPCISMAYTEVSPGFHPATPLPAGGGLADLTDGVPGSTVEAVLADYYRAALVVNYDFDPPASLEDIVVFAANEDPGAPGNGRIFQTYDVWISADGGASYEALATSVTSGEFGEINDEDNRATFTHLYDGVTNLVEDITNVRFVFYCVSNTAGRFQDPWQGNFNEDAGFQTQCPDTDPQDVDGYRKAFEAPIIKEIDVFGFYYGDADDDRDLDIDDAGLLGACMTGPGQMAAPACDRLDFPAQDGDVDMADVARFQQRFTGN